MRFHAAGYSEVRMKKIAVVVCLSLSGLSGAAAADKASPRGDAWTPGAGWKLEWSDEFEGRALNHDYWTAELGSQNNGWGNSELEKYTEDPENIFLKDGKLVIRAVYKGGGADGINYTSARIKTQGKKDFLYGRIAARMKLVKGQGLWPAFWMLGSAITEKEWPSCGEIDIMEAGKEGNFHKVGGTLHFRDWRGEWLFLSGEARVTGGSVADDYHVYEAEWTPGKIIWRLDGVEYHEQPISAPDMSAFHKPFFILLNLAVGGKGTTYTGLGSVPDLKAFPQEMLVDWVRVYRREAGK